MLLQTNSYIVPRDKRVEHARILRRFRQTLLRLGCDHFEVYEQVGANWTAGETSGRFVQIMRFRDRKHQTEVQTAERADATAQALLREFCDLINLPYQQQQGLFAVGYYTSFLRMPTVGQTGAEAAPALEQSAEQAAGGESTGAVAEVGEPTEEAAAPVEEAAAPVEEAAPLAGETGSPVQEAPGEGEMATETSGEAGGVEGGEESAVAAEPVLEVEAAVGEGEASGELEPGLEPEASSSEVSGETEAVDESNHRPLEENTGVLDVVAEGNKEDSNGEREAGELVSSESEGGELEIGELELGESETGESVTDGLKGARPISPNDDTLPDAAVADETAGSMELLPAEDSEDTLSAEGRGEIPIDPDSIDAELFLGPAESSLDDTAELPPMQQDEDASTENRHFPSNS